MGGHPARRGNGVCALYDRYWRRTFTAVYARIGDQAVCEEIVQAISLILRTERAHLQIAAFPCYRVPDRPLPARGQRQPPDATPTR